MSGYNTASEKASSQVATVMLLATEQEGEVILRLFGFLGPVLTVRQCARDLGIKDKDVVRLRDSAISKARSILVREPKPQEWPVL